VKRIFLTGHTGFKGTWFTHYLNELGFQVSGYSDAVKPGSLFDLTDSKRDLETHIIGDVRDRSSLEAALNSSQCDTLVHFAAQPIVISSYENPEVTFDINTRGTWNVVTAAVESGIKKILIITTDKVYKDTKTRAPFSEESPLGGHDPYAASKAAADIIAQSLARKFGDSIEIQVARAGNVIGGGDTSPFRLVPDIEIAIAQNQDLSLRNIAQVRPWQHVLDCLNGYLAIMEAGSRSSEWNVGPTSDEPEYPVSEFVSKYLLARGASLIVNAKAGEFVETDYLRLDTNKIQSQLSWKPIWDTQRAIQRTAEWYNMLDSGLNPRDILKKQISSYLG
jgi:CDP-glucose 4,6-dehydratase